MHIYCNGTGTNYAKRIATRYKVPFDEVMSIDADQSSGLITIKSMKHMEDGELTFITMEVTTNFDWLDK